MEYVCVVLKQHEVHHAHGHVFLKRMPKLYPMKTIYFVSIILLRDNTFFNINNNPLSVVHLTDTFYAESKITWIPYSVWQRYCRYKTSIYTLVQHL